MKKQGTTDAKKAAANDVEKEGPKAAKTAPKPAEDAKYRIGSTDTVRRGFLKEFCDFTRKKGTVDAAMLIAEFAGRQINGHKIDAARVHRYLRYCAKQRTVQAGQVSDPLFALGQVVMTPGAAAAFEASGDDPLAFLLRVSNKTLHNKSAWALGL